MGVKAAFFDIDGTIVSFKTHVMPSSVYDTLFRLKAAGVRIAVVSGRPVSYIDNVKDVPFDAMVGCNGAMAFAGGELVYSHPIDRAQAVKAARTAVANNIPTFTFSESDSGINCMNERSTEIRNLLNIKVPPFRDLVAFCAGNDIYEFTTYVTEEEEQRLYRQGPDALTGVDYIRWHPMFTDINPAGVDKALALEQLCRHWGIAREDTIAFGDGGNDIPMLRWAGTGVAMGGAKADVCQAADYLTSSVDEDGVTAALEHFGILPVH